MSAVLLDALRSPSPAMPRGIVHGMPNAEYHALSAIGSTGLRRLARSPLHFYGQTLDPGRPIVEPTPSMRRGTLAHCALLEPDELVNRYRVRPEGLDGRTKEGRAWLEQVPPGFEVVTAAEMLTAQRQAASVRALPEIGALLAGGGSPEVSAFWTDKATGLHCKCRPDWVTNPTTEARGVALLDLKTCERADPEGFAKSVDNWGYDIQAAYYTEGYERASGDMVLGFVFIAVEHDYPHAAAAYMLPDVWISDAERRVHQLLDLCAECEQRGQWPGYVNTIEPLVMPRWVEKRIQQASNQLITTP